MTKRPVPAVLLALVLLGACGPSRSTTLDKVDKSQQGRAEARKSLEGVLTATESNCVVDKLFARSELTVGQIEDFAKTADPSSPVLTAYREIMPVCVDPNASVTPGPLSKELREGLVKGLKAGIPGATDEKAGCLLDAMMAGGLTVRDLTLAGYGIPGFAEKLPPVIQPAMTTCGLP